MKRDKKYSNIIEILLIITISTILMLIGIYYMPLQFIIFLYGIPFVVVGVKYEINTAIITMVISTFAIGLLTDYISGLSLLAIFLPFSISLIYTIKNRKKSTEIMIISTLVLIVSFFLILALIGNLAGVSIIDQIDEFFTQLLDLQMEVLGETDLSPYDIFKLRDTMEDRLNEILVQLPAMLMIMSLIISYTSYFISVLILRKLGYGIVHTPRFSRFKLPNNILLGVGIMLMGTFIIRGLKILNYESITINMTLLISFVFFLQGFAVIDYKLKARKLNLAVRIMIVFLLTVFLPLGTLITFLGMLDSIFDFRKIRKPVK